LAWGRINLLSNKAVSPVSQKKKTETHHNKQKEKNRTGFNHRNNVTKATPPMARSLNTNRNVVDIKKTKEKINELRVAGKCFICEEVGHLSQDCKKKQTFKPLKIATHNVQIDFDQMEKEVEEAIELEVNMMNFLEGLSSNCWYGDSKEPLTMNELINILQWMNVSDHRRNQLIVEHHWERARRYWHELPGYQELAAWRADSEDGRSDVLKFNNWIFESEEDENETIRDDNDEIPELTESSQNVELGNSSGSDESGYYSVQEIVQASLEPAMIQINPSDEESLFTSWELLEQADSSGTPESEIEEVESEVRLEITDDELEERAMEEQLWFILACDEHKEWCIEMYFKYIMQLKELMAPEHSIINEVDRYTLQFQFQLDDNGQILHIIDNFTDARPLVIRRTELEQPLFHMVNAIERDPEWKEKRFATDLKKKQVAEMILDRFAKHSEISVALEQGITAREWFEVQPIGTDSGYLVQDQLCQPGFWWINKDDLWKDWCTVENVIQDQGDLLWPLTDEAGPSSLVFAMAVNLITGNFMINSAALTPIAAKKKGIPYKDRSKEREDVINSITCTSAKPKDFERRVPLYIVMNAEVNGNPVRALIDSGSLADFTSTTVADQLQLKLDWLAKPVPCTMAASRSRMMIQYSTQVEFKLDEIKETCCFDMMNLEQWDLILGTPFLYQHSISLGFNPSRLSIGSTIAQKMEGDEILKLSSMVADILENELEKLCQMLRKEAERLCRSAEETLFTRSELEFPLPENDK
jgi:hypothetical protein